MNNNLINQIFYHGVKCFNVEKEKEDSYTLKYDKDDVQHIQNDLLIIDNITLIGKKLFKVSSFDKNSFSISIKSFFS